MEGVSGEALVRVEGVGEAVVRVEGLTRTQKMSIRE